jgi:hypothetical protein
MPPAYTIRNLLKLRRSVAGNEEWVNCGWAEGLTAGKNSLSDRVANFAGGSGAIKRGVCGEKADAKTAANFNAWMRAT